MSTENRETFGSRLGFILLSAGCAIGIGNVWKFPWMVGQHGGGLFVLTYLIFLALLGLPLLMAEFATGRAAHRTIARLHETLTPAHARLWSWHGWMGLGGCWLLMMFYTTVSGWMLLYFLKSAAGCFTGLDAAGVGAAFNACLADPLQQLGGMLVVSAAGFAVCACGLQQGLERATKWMMLVLLVLMLVLAVNSAFLSGGETGLAFYLKPSFAAIGKEGLLPTIVAAMNQAFFTLSLGIGSMAVFGSYLNRDRTLFGEALNVAALDTFVALLAGLIIFPACTAFGVQPDAGPSLIFVTLPNVFNAMPLGRLWGTVFFAFMTAAAFTTVLAVFENLVAGLAEHTGWSRRKSALACGLAMPILSAPCALGFNLLQDFHPLGGKSTVLDLEDFLVSDLALPVGALTFALYCTRRFGWGWDSFAAEVNTGRGPKMPGFFRPLLSLFAPAAILIILAAGLKSRFGL